LRRKLEETKSVTQQHEQHNFNIDDFLGRKAAILNFQNHNLQEKNTIVQQKLQLNIPETSRTTSTNTGFISPVQNRSTTMEMPIKKNTETGVQTSIENKYNFIYERPTRDDAKVKIRNNNPIEQKLKTRKSSKSPTYKSTSTVLFDKTISSVQRSNISDFTKISSIFEAVMASNNNNNQNSIEYLRSFNKEQNNLQDDSNNSSNINNNTELVVYKEKKGSTSKLIDSDNSRINNNLIFDSSYYESDEILNILFKKLFFYQSKLR
jgi:hypothetical protein